jgi:IS5 family transposase
VHRRTVGIALEKKVVAGRRMRVDATVVEINIHDPADSAPMGDGVKVRTRVMKKAAGEAGVTLRDRSRSVKRSILGYRESQTTAR